MNKCQFCSIGRCQRSSLPPHVRPSLDSVFPCCTASAAGRLHGCTCTPLSAAFSHGYAYSALSTTLSHSALLSVIGFKYGRSPMLSCLRASVVPTATCMLVSTQRSPSLHHLRPSRPCFRSSLRSTFSRYTASTVGRFHPHTYASLSPHRFDRRSPPRTRMHSSLGSALPRCSVSVVGCPTAAHALLPMQRPHCTVFGHQLRSRLRVRPLLCSVFCCAND
jgi:hypothetical protein